MRKLFPFVSRRRLDEESEAKRDYQLGYTREVEKRCAAEDAARAHRHRATVLAQENDRLRSLLSQAHFRNPKTGRLSPRGVYQLEVN